jgi:hypothetical protein
MRITTILLSVVLSSATCQSPCQIPTPAAPGTPPTTPTVPWTDHYRRATISFGKIDTVDGKQTFQVIGTGVIVAPDAHHAYIVTAKHVFYEPKANWHPAELHVRFASQEKRTFTEELGLPLTLIDPRGQDLWIALKDDSDIAATPAPDSFRALLTDAIGYADFASEDDVYDGASVFVFGFPGDSAVLTGPNGLVRAITRSGIIAWTDPNGALSNPLLLDSNILPGNSGGPAFKVPTGLTKSGMFQVGGKIAFLGIVTSTVQNSYAVTADGKIVVVSPNPFQPGAAEQIAVAGIGALGRVEPAAKVKMLIDRIQTAHQ